MGTLNFSIKLGAEQDDLFSLLTNYKKLPTFLPDQLKNVDIIEESDQVAVTEETLVFSSLIKKTIIQKTQHKIIAQNKLQSTILSGPAEGTEINVSLEKDNNGTLITVIIELKLDFKTKIFSPMIKKWYKSILTGIFYKMNTEIINSDN